MAFYFDVARDSGGRVLSGATVNVYQTGTSTAASIFSDSALSTAKANPFTAGTDGLFSFYIADGNYRVLVSKTGYSSFDIDPVPIEGPRTGSGENRTLLSTSHATKGKILFGTSAYDEANNRLGLGTATPNASSIIDLTSTTGSLLLPRMTTTQRDALTAANGMVVYNSTANEVQIREGGAWASGLGAKAISVTSYGATGDGTTDDTTAIADALAAACAADVPLYFPAGNYKVAGSGSAIFTITEPIEIFGDGYASWIMPATGVPTTRDVFFYDPSGTGSKFFSEIRGLRIEGQSAGVARYGIHWLVPDASQAFTKFSVQRVYFKNLNSFALFADGSLGATPSISNCWIRDCQVIGNGFGGTEIADSINIENCVFGGSGYGIDITDFQAGSGKLSIRNCTVTASAGVRIGGPNTSPVITNNFFEVLQTYDGANNAYLDLNGASGSVIAGPVVTDNLLVVLGSFGDPDALRINWCDDAVVDNNRFILTPAGSDAIAITSNANRAHLGASNVYSGGGRFTNSGAASSGGTKVLCLLTADSTAIANTTDETVFDKEFTIPANYLKAGQLVRVRSCGKFSTTGTPTLTIRIALNVTVGPPVSGGTPLMSTGAITTSSGASGRPWVAETEFLIRTIGASGTLQRHGSLGSIESTIVGNAGVGTLGAEAVLDTTAAITIYVMADWSAASASNTVLMNGLIVELVDTPGRPS